MRKIIIVKLVILLIIIVSCCFGYFKYYNIKSDITILELSIKKTKVDIENANNKIEITKDNIEKLKKEKKDSIWELDSWKRMKEKIEKAL